MNLVTPLSFIDHIMRRFGFMTNLHLDFHKMRECLILDIVTDSRLLHYPPSIIATIVINEIELYNAVKYQNQLLSVLKVRKDSLEECHDLILELMGTSCYKLCQSLKHKHQSVPSSPSGIIDAYFSSDSSNESWSVASSISCSPEPLYKRNKTQDQQITLAPMVIGDARGRALLLGIELVTERKLKTHVKSETLHIMDLMKDMGVLVGKGGFCGNVFRITPPVYFTKEDADFMADVMDCAM